MTWTEEQRTAHDQKWAEIEQTLTPIAMENPVDVYRAFCNVLWVPLTHPAQTYNDVATSDPLGFATSWRYSGGMVAEWRDKGEGYMDFYCSGGEGHVSDEVRAAMLKIGMRPVT